MNTAKLRHDTQIVNDFEAYRTDAATTVDLDKAAIFLGVLTGEADGFTAPVTFQWFDDQNKGRVKPGHIHGSLRELSS